MMENDIVTLSINLKKEFAYALKSQKGLSISDMFGRFLEKHSVLAFSVKANKKKDERIDKAFEKAKAKTPSKAQSLYIKGSFREFLVEESQRLEITVTRLVNWMFYYYDLEKFIAENAKVQIEGVVKYLGDESFGVQYFCQEDERSSRNATRALRNYCEEHEWYPRVSYLMQLLKTNGGCAWSNSLCQENIWSEDPVTHVEGYVDTRFLLTLEEDDLRRWEEDKMKSGFVGNDFTL